MELFPIRAHELPDGTRKPHPVSASDQSDAGSDFGELLADSPQPSRGDGLQQTEDLLGGKLGKSVSDDGRMPDAQLVLRDGAQPGPRGGELSQPVLKTPSTEEGYRHPKVETDAVGRDKNQSPDVALAPQKVGVTENGTPAKTALPTLQSQSEQRPQNAVALSSGGHPDAAKELQKSSPVAANPSGVMAKPSGPAHMSTGDTSDPAVSFDSLRTNQAHRAGIEQAARHDSPQTGTARGDAVQREMQNAPMSATAPSLEAGQPKASAEPDLVKRAVPAGDIALSAVAKGSAANGKTVDAVDAQQWNRSEARHVTEAQTGALSQRMSSDPGVPEPVASDRSENRRSDTGQTAASGFLAAGSASSALPPAPAAQSLVPHVQAQRDMQLIAPVEDMPVTLVETSAGSLDRTGLHSSGSIQPANMDGRQIMRQIAEASVQIRDGGIELQLSPEELGRVKMTMSAGENGIHIQIIADRPETLELLRRHAALLGQELFANGVKADGFSFAGGEAGAESDPGSPQRAMAEQELHEAETGTLPDQVLARDAPIGVGTLDIRL